MTRFACAFTVFFCSFFLLAGEDESVSLASPANADKQLEQILQQPLYQRWKLRQQRVEEASGEDFQLSDSMRETLNEMMKSAGKSLKKFFDWAFGGSRNRNPGSNWSWGGGGIAGLLEIIAWIVLLGLLVFIALIIYRAYREKSRIGKTNRILSREQVHKALVGGEALALTDAQWLSEAQRLAAANDFRAAYRAIYLALLSGLHEFGKIDFRRNRTNWIYVRNFRGQEAERRVFDELTGLFDQVWYGRKLAQGSSLGALQVQVAKLLRKDAGT